ncbi:hypothetical protein FRB99_001462 [Tulasnella sp. 403]|nr:hypothetical protein FRB99_001462 [Tulasnella sp. 403]
MGLFSSSSGPSLPSYLLGRSSQQQRSGGYGATDENQPSSPSLVPKLPPTPRPSSRPSSPMMATSGMTSPRRDRLRPYDLEDLVEVDEEADEVEELVDVPYSTLVRNYTLVPISAYLFLGSLTVLFAIAWPSTSDSNEPSGPASAPWYPRPHLASLLVGASAWVVSYSLRVPLFLLSSCLATYADSLAISLSTVLHVALEEAMRLGALVLLGIRLGDGNSNRGDDEWGLWPRPGDDAFRKTFYVAVGWAFVEVAWSVAQGYEQLALYRDLLPPSPSFLQQYYSGSHVVPDDVSSSSESESISHRYVHAALKKSISPPESRPRGPLSRSSIDAGLYGEAALDAEMRELINLQSRTELEMVYGVPPPNIPVFISILQRIDSILLTIGLTLTISSVYLAQLANHSAPPPSESLPNSSPPSILVVHPESTPAEIEAALTNTFPSYVVLTLLHGSLALMWTEALPRIGVHTASYTALVVSLGVFFAGLAWWGALN